MCYTELYQYQCSCGKWTSRIPGVPSKPANVCLRCHTDSIPDSLAVAVERMTDAINAEVTSGAGEIMAVEPFDEFTGPMIDLECHE